ncbi:MAG: hypothetical protein FJ138_12635 [Deltaproteobacteria bacterium]|nr:hypothetical protein [Deltaproteobacteria bacterium]
MSSSSLLSLGDGVMSTLSDREKLSIGLVVVLVLCTVVWFVSSALSDEAALLREQRDLLSADLAEVRAASPDFLRRKERLAAYEERLLSNQLDLSKMMERAARDQGFNIEDFKENRRVLDEELAGPKKGKKQERKALVAYSQQVTIRTVSLKQLAAFLQAVEADPAPVRVTSLEVTPSTGDRQELRSVRLSVTTYKREKDN